MQPKVIVIVIVTNSNLVIVIYFKCGNLVVVLAMANMKESIHWAYLGLRGVAGGSWGARYPPPPSLVAVNDIIQTISARLEQSNLCHMQLASSTIDLRRPWTRALFQLTSWTVYFEAAFTRKRFHIDMVP